MIGLFHMCKTIYSCQWRMTEKVSEDVLCCFRFESYSLYIQIKYMLLSKTHCIEMQWFVQSQELCMSCCMDGFSRYEDMVQILHHCYMYLHLAGREWYNITCIDADKRIKGFKVNLFLNLIYESLWDWWK